jgi:hypothetical protein
MKYAVGAARIAQQFAGENNHGDLLAQRDPHESTTRGLQR